MKAVRLDGIRRALPGDKRTRSGSKRNPTVLFRIFSPSLRVSVLRIKAARRITRRVGRPVQGDAPGVRLFQGVNAPALPSCTR